MKNNFKEIIFDMGGVILRTADPAPRDLMARRMRITRMELEEFVFHSPTSILSEVGTISDIAHWEKVLNHFKQDDADPVAAYNEFFSGDCVDLDLMDFISDLRTQYKVGMLSNAWTNARARIGSMYSFLDKFDNVIFSAEVGTRKPEKEIFQLMLEKLGSKAGEAIFIDDFYENIAGAQILGITTIHFQDSKDTIRQIKTLLERA